MPAKTTTKAKTVAKKAPVAVASAPKKKVAKKVVAKKAPVKALCPTCKATSTQEQAFWVNNGPVVDSLKGLKQALKDMTEEQYFYHTSRAGNDFATWVRDCVGDTACAVRIAKAKTRDGTVTAIACTC